MDVKYRTQFHLLADVNDIDVAQRYLTEDDMTKYLVHHLADESPCGYFKPSLVHLKDKIKHIEWHLTSEDRGYIELITTEEIPQAELDQISEWVSGQCSDGLGEGFEQQPFANYDYSGDGDDWVMASFDWKANKYIFSRFNG